MADAIETIHDVDELTPVSWPVQAPLARVATPPPGGRIWLYAVLALFAVNIMALAW